MVKNTKKSLLSVPKSCQALHFITPNSDLKHGNGPSKNVFHLLFMLKRIMALLFKQKKSSTT